LFQVVEASQPAAAKRQSFVFGKSQSSTRGIMGLRATQGDEKRVLFSN
jgi:hypothetical protein